MRVLERLAAPAGRPAARPGQRSRGLAKLIALPLKLMLADASPVRHADDEHDLREPLTMTSRDERWRSTPPIRWRRLRDEFVLPEGVVYLDGNSLGALPRRTAARLAEVAREWGEGLIRSWNSAGWIDLSRRIGDKIATLVGARPGEVSVGDSTSVNLFKVLGAAATLPESADAPDARSCSSERSNFPTDLYIAESVATAAGLTLRLVIETELARHLDGGVAVLMLTHVNYRSPADPHRSPPRAAPQYTSATNIFGQGCIRGERRRRASGRREERFGVARHNLDVASRLCG